MNKSELLYLLKSRLARIADNNISLSVNETLCLISALQESASSGETFSVKLPDKKYYSTSYGQVEAYSAFEIEEMLRKNNILFNK